MPSESAGARRCRLTAAAVLAVFTVAAAVADSATFASNVRTQMAAILYLAGAIEPATEKEDRESRREQRQRHKELAAWFDSKNRDISLRNCTSEQDKANYGIFRTAMANKEFLALKFKRRRRFIGKINDHFAAFETHFDDALSALVTPPAAGSAALEAHFAERLQIPVQLSLRYFGRTNSTTLAAMYHPRSHNIYLNLNYMISYPAQFIDSLEHELWHHLLPIVDRENVVDNIWWEGFNEATCELWTAALYDRIERPAVGPSDSIEYPVQTAFASLFLDVDRRRTLEFLAAAIDAGQFRDALADNELGTALVELMQEPHFARDGQKRVTDMLSDWGWKEDDGSLIDISKYVDGDHLERRAMSGAFLYDKEMFVDLIQAITVCKLQDLRKRVPPSRILHGLSLPDHLRKNVADILEYVDFPYHQHGKR